MLNNPDEGSVKGKGAETMLPARGNPFQPTGSGPAPAAPSGAGTPDLTPEDLASLFPDAPSPNLAAEVTAMGSPGASAVDPAFAATMQPYANLPEVPVAAPGAAVVATATTVATTVATATATLAAAPAAQPAAQPDGERPTGNNMYDPDIEWIGLEINPDAIGPRAEKYERAEELPADAALLTMFATDTRLKQRWGEIDELENRLTSMAKLSQSLAQLMLDRLQTARNLLLNNRDQIEDAERELAEVRFRYEHVKRSRYFEQPSFIFGSLLVMMVLAVLGFAWPLVNFEAFETLSRQLELLQLGDGVRLIDLWSTILWGALGGITGALYGLWTHVADKKDFDPGFSIWYYTNPLMGMMLGAFVYVVVMSGVLTFLQNSPMVLYILAWVVGFQQNLAFKLVNNVLKRLTPATDEKGVRPEGLG